MMLRRGKHLFRQGEPFNSLYIIKSGSIKNYACMHNGSHQVIDFTLPGEILGLDSMDGDRYMSSAVAMESTHICKLPFRRFTELCSHLPHLQDRFFHLAGRKILCSNNLLLLMGHKSALERIAVFLLDYSRRMGSRGYSTTEFNLGMPRHDIANYLGLTIETVSRLFSRLDKEGILHVERKFICIADPERLINIAGLSSAPHPISPPEEEQQTRSPPGYSAAHITITGPRTESGTGLH